MRKRFTTFIIILFFIVYFVAPILGFLSMLSEELEINFNPFDYARITDIDYTAVVADSEENGGKIFVTERLTFDIHAASKDNPFWELWRDLPEDTIDGLPIKYKFHSVNQIFGYEALGLYTEEDFVNAAEGILNPNLPENTLGPVRPGDIKYKDVNGDGKIDVYDQTAIGGTEDPEIVYGFGLNMAYKNFDFGVLFQGTGRTYRMLSSNILPGQSQQYYNVFSNYKDRWTVENPSQDVFYPRLTYGANSNNMEASTWWLKNMSFLRLKNLEIGYSLPRKWAERSFISSARIFVRGTNLLTFSSFKLWDPELDSSDGGKYPLMMSISGGLEFKF